MKTCALNWCIFFINGDNGGDQKTKMLHKNKML